MLKSNHTSQRRSNYEIVAHILRIAKKGAKKTRIVYGANLNFKMLQEYVARLEKAGLVTSYQNDGGLIETTEKGKEYLLKFYGLKDFGIT